MKKKYNQITQWIKVRVNAITPGKNAVNGASLGLLTVTAIFWLIYTISIYTDLHDPWILLLSLVFVLAVLLFAFVLKWVLMLLNNVSGFYKLALFIAWPLLIMMSSKSIIPAIILVLASLCGAAVLVIKKPDFKTYRG